MKRDFWNRLESRLLDIYQNRPSVRYLLTSSSGEKRKFEFLHFQRLEDQDQD